MTFVFYNNKFNSHNNVLKLLCALNGVCRLNVFVIQSNL